MKIKQLVEIARQNPDLMEMELSIALRPDEQRGGIWDGAPAILFNPVKTAMFGGEGILLWANHSVTASVPYNPDPRTAAFLAKLVFFGPTPDIYKAKE